MARNSEKRFTGLNRFLEAKEKEARPDQQRPPLHRLHTAGEVRQWIPAIQKEIDYLLQQIQGTGSRKYSDHKIEEFKERIQDLEREHKRFVAKVRSLDPSYRDVVPWQPRAYSRKRSRAVKDEGSEGGPETKKLHSPLVQRGKAVFQGPKPTAAALDYHPLPAISMVTPPPRFTHDLEGGTTTGQLPGEPHKGASALHQSAHIVTGFDVKEVASEQLHCQPNVSGVLGLDYSSSSSSEEEEEEEEGP